MSYGVKVLNTGWSGFLWSCMVHQTLCLFYSLLPILSGRSIHNIWVSRCLFCRQPASFPDRTLWR